MAQPAPAAAAADHMSMLEEQLLALQRQMAELERSHHAYASSLRPTLAACAAREHAATLQAAQSDVDARVHQLQQEQAAWLITQASDADASRAMSEERSMVQRELKDLTQAHASLQTTVADLSVLDEAESHRSFHPAPGSFAGLPLFAQRGVLRFLGKADLVRVARTCFSWSHRLDRGALWSMLAVQAVSNLVASQRKMQQAAEAKRRALGGLTPDYHTAQFLACCAAHTPSPAPGGLSDSASPPPPPVLHCEVRIPFTHASPARSKGANGSGTLSKAEMFAGALRTLQAQVDPALSDFEDHSLRLQAHQASISFLEAKMKEQQHQIGVARLQHGSELAALRAATAQKDDLARAIQSLERELDAEKAVQAAALAAEEAEARARRHATNLRRNLESLVQQTDELAEAEPPAEAEPDEAEAAAAAQAEETAANITLLKHQKKVLVRALRSIQTELHQTHAEKEEHSRKLAELKSKLQAVNL